MEIHMKTNKIWFGAGVCSIGLLALYVIGLDPSTEDGPERSSEDDSRADEANTTRSRAVRPHRDTKRQPIRQRSPLAFAMTPTRAPSLISDTLQRALDDAEVGEAVPVHLVLRRDRERANGLTASHGRVEMAHGGLVDATIDDSSVTEQELGNDLARLRAELRASRTNAQTEQHEMMQALQDRLAQVGEAPLSEHAIRGRATLTTALTADQVDALASSDDLLVQMDLVVAHEVEEPHQNWNARDRVGVRDWAVDYQSAGAGIGIWQDEGCADPEAPAWDAPGQNDYRCLGDGDITGHGTDTANTLMWVAPGVTIYNPEGSVYSLGAGGTDPLTPDPDVVDEPPILLVYNEWVIGTSSNPYLGYEHEYDQLAIDDRLALFMPTGNSYGDVNAPARGFNTISIGATSCPGTDSVASYSNGGGTPNGMQKPELVAPGCGNGGGTSNATPVATGFAAAMLENWQFMQNRPHLLKAAMMAGAKPVHAELAAGESSRLSTRAGAGGIDFRRATQQGAAAQQRFAWWDGASNDDFFEDEFGQPISIVVDEIDVLAGQWCRVAVTWMADPDHALANAGELSQDLDLSITNANGELVASSWSRTNSFELAEFQTQAAGDYTVTIDRVANRGSEPVLIGYAFTCDLGEADTYWAVEDSEVGDNATDMLAVEAAAFDGLDDFSFACDVKIDQLRGSGWYPANTLLSCANGTTDNALAFWYEDSSDRFRVRVATSTANFPVTSEITDLLEDGEYHRWTVARSGATLRVSLDDNEWQTPISGNLASTIDAEICILGQEQDTLGGGFHSDQSLWGSMSGCELDVPNAPHAPWVRIAESHPEIGEDLRCDLIDSAVDLDGDALGYSVTWTVDEAPFGGAITTTHPGDTVPAAAVGPGETWRCSMTASDASSSSTAGIAERTMPEALVVDGTTVNLGTGEHRYFEVEVINGGVLEVAGLVDLRAGSITVDASSFIDGVGAGHAGGASANGWATGSDDGAGPGGGGHHCSSTDGAAGGGGHGGIGGDGGIPGVCSAEGPSYGAVSDATTELGSGGGGSVGGVGGPGGGGLRLHAGTIDIDGTVTVDGDDGTRGCCWTSGGGGSGGGLTLFGDTITIAGSLSARGGDGAGYPNNSAILGGGGGGGGRIKVFWGSSYDLTGTLDIDGGEGGVSSNPGRFGEDGGTGTTHVAAEFFVFQP